MSLGRDVAAALPGLRSAAESLMVDTWRSDRHLPGTEPVFNDETGEWTAGGDPVPVYDGPGRLRDQDGAGRRVDRQGETTVVGALRLSLPVATSGGVRVDDVLECTASTFDASLVGVKVRVTDLHQSTHSTARRFSVEVTSWPTSTT